MYVFLMNQGIIDMNRNGNSANFFSYVCNDKKIKELFASTLNGIPISVRCVASIIVILTLNLTNCLRRTQPKKSLKTKEARQECRVLLVETTDVQLLSQS